MDRIEDRFLRIDRVVEKTGRSRASIYRMVADGSFPKQERIGVRAVGWRMSAVLEWMDAPNTYAESRSQD
jgi:prophage regulatory protein